ncbi:kinase-like domain-containing protein [Catenaria anguillulae PL171]|uniref:Kinase-like domain-containing protein n=1 Tax=Catenaria anguillulae PL171 TaxID=765915 RepID=A0A1Y2HIH7_9FUNG|nr:kinase-like domain-containing protein [Catenaria anguillulae PL171]
MDLLVSAFRHLLFAWHHATDKNHDHCLLLGDFKFLYQSKIAEGGYGTVFLARDLNAASAAAAKDGDMWALKRVAAADNEMRDAYHREVQAHMSTKGHPRIMQLLASDIVSAPSGAQGFLVMPYMRNGDLQQFVDLRYSRNQPLSPSLIITLFRSICEGVRAFHSQEPPLALCDIKPANILLGDDGRSTVLTDLGSVCPAIRPVTSRAQANTLQDEFAMTITAPYRAPECFSVPSQCTLDTRTDMWSLGCVLYFMCCGKPAFDGTESSARARIDLDGIPEAGPLRQLVKDMLSVQMADRPKIDQVLQMLEGIPDTFS